MRVVEPSVVARTTRRMKVARGAITICDPVTQWTSTSHQKARKGKIESAFYFCYLLSFLNSCILLERKQHRRLNRQCESETGSDVQHKLASLYIKQSCMFSKAMYVHQRFISCVTVIEVMVQRSQSCRHCEKYSQPLFNLLLHGKYE